MTKTSSRSIDPESLFFKALHGRDIGSARGADLDCR
jgi:hypothetical protein